MQYTGGPLKSNWGHLQWLFLKNKSLCLLLRVSWDLWSSVHFTHSFFSLLLRPDGFLLLCLQICWVFFQLTPAIEPLPWSFHFSYYTSQLQNFYLVCVVLCVSVLLFSNWGVNVIVLFFNSSKMISRRSLNMVLSLRLPSPALRIPQRRFWENASFLWGDALLFLCVTQFLLESGHSG